MQKIEIPTCCPVCDYKLELVKDQLFCRNSACEAQVGKKIEHFAKTLKIKGLGPATVEKLQLEDVTQIFYLDKDEVAGVIGDKLAVKLLEEIEKSKSSDLATVIASFSIPLVGNSASTKLAPLIDSLNEITLNKCREAGLGDKVTQNLLYWFNTEYQEIKEFLPFTFKKKVEQVTGQLVCITGKLVSFSTKKEAAEALNAKGYRVTDNLTKTVDFLIDESNKSSAKRLKAEKDGIPVITDLLKFLTQ